jgi:hypothetical protein
VGGSVSPCEPAGDARRRTLRLACDDAIFGAIDGMHDAHFDRAAPTVVDAVSPAIRAAESVPGLRVMQVEPNDRMTTHG